MASEALPFIDKLIEHIDNRRGQCLLLLGPELSVNKTGTNYRKYCKEIVEPSLPSLKYFHQDNLFQADPTDATLLPEILRIFYREVGDPIFLEMLSRIQFPLIINVAPDISLQEKYGSLKIDFKEGYFSAGYNTNMPLDSLEPTKNMPIIYNMFGTVEDPGSMVTTYPQLYTTIEYLLRDNALPNGVQGFIKSAQSFLFLGFKLDSWYYQLLCHKLGITSSPVKPAVCTPGMDESDQVSIIMKKNFNISFSSLNSLECIQMLVAQCKKSLRPPSPVSHYSTFVSYAHNSVKDQDRERIVDLIEAYYSTLADRAYYLFRDQNDISFGESIDSFMHMIGKGKSVIMVITDKFLRSEYCMTEALRVSEYHDEMKRIFFIIVSDQQNGVDMIRRLADTGSYHSFWLTECQEAISDRSKGENGRLERLAKIAGHVTRFMNDVATKKNLVLDYADFQYNMEKSTYELSVEQAVDFERFMVKVMDKLKQ